MKLKHKEIPEVRQQMYEAQKGLCCLCGNSMTPDQAVLDHDHVTGHVRGVLHRQCNHAEGRIVSWIRRTGKYNEPVDFLQRLTKYWKADHTSKPIHSTHRTQKEKEILKLKRRIRKLKTAKGRQRLLLKIKELQNETPINP